MAYSAHQLATILTLVADGPWPIYVNDLPGDRAASSAVVQLLESFGAIVPVEDGSYRLPSESAEYFLRSFAEYVRSGRPLLSGWGRAIPAEGTRLGGSLNGPALTLEMESCRSSWEAAVAIRSTEVAQVIIKARLGWRVGDRYLVRWDPQASAYQLVGGHRRTEDLTIDDTIRRELEEEVPGLLDTTINDRLSHLAEASVVQVSRTHGALTQYQMHVFTASFAEKKPRLSQSERWIAASDLARGKLRSGEVINQVVLTKIFPDTSEGLKALPTSFSTTLRPPPRLVARQVGASAIVVTTVIASIVAIVQFVAWLMQVA